MNFLRDEAPNPVARLLLVHGAGAPMDHPWMNAMTSLLVANGISVARFEFEFMETRRHGGKSRPAPRGDKLVPEYAAAIASLQQELNDQLPLYIGGKSLGGRVASLVAADHCANGAIGGLVCFGYPFHPAGKPEKLRTQHLAQFDCPALIIQGSRDPLGTRDEVESYALDPRIQLLWLEDGDHDLKPRKKSGETLDGHMQAAARAVLKFTEQ